MAPSTAIGHQDKIIPLKTFVQNIFTNAENILNSWGFKNKEFNTLSS